MLRTIVEIVRYTSKSRGERCYGLHLLAYFEGPRALQPAGNLQATFKQPETDRSGDPDLEIAGADLP